MKKYLLILLLSLSSCCVQEKKDIPAETPISMHPLTMATLFNHYAEEYRALAYQAFNIATERVDEMLDKGKEAGKCAIVVDIDETLLDNSPADAILIAKDTSYPFMWFEWTKLASARAVPGAVEFLRYADEKGFAIFYISNRKEDPEQAWTIHNLESLGFPQVDNSHFMLKRDRSDENPNPSDKQSRRDLVTEKGYEIVLLIGDNLGDFYTDEMGFDVRTAQVDAFRKEFGNRFIVLPNPVYGNWQKSLGIRDAEVMDSLIRDMTKVFD